MGLTGMVRGITSCNRGMRGQREEQGQRDLPPERYQQPVLSAMRKGRSFVAGPSAAWGTLGPARDARACSWWLRIALLFQVKSQVRSRSPDQHPPSAQPRE